MNHRKVYAENAEVDSNLSREKSKPSSKQENKSTSDTVKAISDYRNGYIRWKYGLEKLVLSAAWNVGFRDRKNDHRQLTEKRFREVVVGVQAQLHSKPRNYGLYYYVKVGDLDRVKQMIQHDDDLINRWDAAGAAAFHLAYVFQHYHIGRYLVEKYPDLALQPYKGHQTEEIKEEFSELAHEDFNTTMMPYTGATVLHVAIVRRNFEEVRWLLNFYYQSRDIVVDGLSRLLSSNVTGKFFAVDGDLYLGGLPLHFAVCANHIGIVDLIMSYASKTRLVLPDSYVFPEIEINRDGSKDADNDTLGTIQQTLMETFSLSGKEQFMLKGIFGSSARLHENAKVEEEAQTQTVLDKEKEESVHIEHKDQEHLEVEDMEESEISTPQRYLSPRIRGAQADSKTHQQTHKQLREKDIKDKEEAQRREKNRQRSISGHNMIFLSDLSGNTTLHLCVRYGLKEMYEHIHRTAKRILTAEIKELYAAYAHKGVGAIVRLKNIPHTAHGYMMFPKVITIPERDKYEDWVRTEVDAKLDERLILALNSDLHSTLTLAAAIIQREDCDRLKERRITMFQSLLQYNKTPLWTYGAVKVSRMKLEGVEIKYNLERYQHIPQKKYKLPRHAAIDWLCINDADPKVILITEIQRFIQTKWERCGYPSFVVRFLLHTFLTVLITLIMLFPNISPSVKDITPAVILVDILYPIVGIIFLWLLWCEAVDLIKYGTSYFSTRGVALYDKILQCVKIVSFLLFAVYNISSMQTTESYKVVNGKVKVSDSLDSVLKVSLAVCVMASWMHLYYFLMGFDSTGPFMLTIFRIVGRNVPYFLRFYVVIVVTFACGLSLLTNNGTVESSYAFRNIILAIWSLLQVTVGIDPSESMYGIDIYTDVAPHLHWLADIFLTGYYASVVILMINLLIAMIGHTYEEYIGYNTALLLIEKYNIMHAIERSMSPSEYEYYRSFYSHRTKVVIDSLKRENSSRSFSRAISGFASSAKGSAKGLEVFAKHVTIESSNYDFELQEVDEEWFSNKQAQIDTILSRERCPDAPYCTLLLVCPQNDFYPGGSLQVDDAAFSAGAIAAMIQDNGHLISNIIVMMATHHYGDLTHYSAWENYNGERPRIGEKITYRALLEGDWHARSITQQEWFEIYAKRLEGEHKRELTILPEHCILGTSGHSVHPIIHASLQHWAEWAKHDVQYIHFGSNKRTYMYSAMQAAVEDPLDAATSLNIGLLNTLLECDKVIVCGPDLSNTVMKTVQSLLQNWGQDNGKLILLSDGGGIVHGQESATKAFYAQCAQKGVTVTTCARAFENYAGTQK